MLDKSVDTPKKFLYDVLFCKSRLSKMASSKTNKIKKWAPLLMTNFSYLATLFLGPKPYLYSKGP